MVDRRAGPGIWASLSLSHSRTLARRPSPFLPTASIAVVYASLSPTTGTLAFTQIGLLTGTSWSVTAGTDQWYSTSGRSLPAVESRLPRTLETDR
ncbi:MAG TPA: hypothetical protein VKT21_02905 [Thermoplasmata archaeon]|nr:hypothetical protein [Thermoplasmata archaeon]